MEWVSRYAEQAKGGRATITKVGEGDFVVSEKAYDPATGARISDQERHFTPRELESALNAAQDQKNDLQNQIIALDSKVSAITALLDEIKSVK